MTRLRTICPTALLVAALLAGCGSADGGRGSSGFDISENFIITQVLESQQCLSEAGVTFCPADQQTPSAPTPTATPPTPTVVTSPTPTAAVGATPRVDTTLANGASIACTRTAPGSACTLTFNFAALGLSPSATFGVATRLRDPDTAWTLAPPPVVDTGTDPPLFATTIDLQLPDDPPDRSVQFAVLVFLADSTGAPMEFERLSESGADVAFVTPDFALEIITTDPPPSSPTATPNATPSEPTAPPATPTVAPPAVGPIITYFGVARADNVSLAPGDVDSAGRPIYVRPTGSGMSLIIEGRPGESRARVGLSAYDSSGGLPDLQVIVARPLGDGSTAICDIMPPDLGGVPATDPLMYAGTTAAAINDLGCRVDGGSGVPEARTDSQSACTVDRFGDFSFVGQASTVQFCLPIAGAWPFPIGDTVVAARLRDVSGAVGPVREIVVRNAASRLATPTMRHTATPRPSATVNPRTATSTPRPTPAGVTSTPSRLPSPPPTFTPDVAAVGPIVTQLGLARADDQPISPTATDDLGRPVVVSRLGSGLSIIVEAGLGTDRRPVGLRAYAESGLPDLQMLVSRDLGDGSPVVCDALPPRLGGVPAVLPLSFDARPEVTAAINDLGCRVNDGTGAPIGRTSAVACTRSDRSGGGGYGFIDVRSTVQFCLPIAAPWGFPVGDTVVAVRVGDSAGNFGPVREMVVRIDRGGP